MSRVSIALAEVLTDLVAPIDLTSCPPEEAAALVEEAYRFLPANARVSLEEGRVVIEAPELSDRESRRPYACGRHPLGKQPPGPNGLEGPDCVASGAPGKTARLWPTAGQGQAACSPTISSSSERLGT